MDNVLERLADEYLLEALPQAWRMTDFEYFSANKRLYPYQQKALENALKILFVFYQQHETKDTTALKKDFLREVRRVGLSSEQERTHFEVSPKVKKQESKVYPILLPYYAAEYNRILSSYHFVNRMSFWMATGSGKSIVLIKLLETLNDLMQYEQLPRRNILFLTHRSDLIAQLKTHIAEFNTYLRQAKGVQLVVRDLKEFPKRHRDGDLFRSSFVDIYCYRSDLISDTQKENIVDFREYDNEGRWFVILDEAHKGDNDESKRKQYFNILSRNGFLFNFSATFTEPADILTTVYNFNLATYIQKGFGKHLYLFNSQFEAFKRGKTEMDFEQEDKQKIVLMSLLMLTFVKKEIRRLREADKRLRYHEPLLLTLVNSVTAQDSDLSMFFEEVRRVAKNEVAQKIFTDAKVLLKKDLQEQPQHALEDSKVLTDESLERIKDLTLADVRALVFNTAASGELEVRRNPKNKHELSFRVKSAASSAPFALIKIGDTKTFEQNNLQHYNIEEAYEDSSLFEQLEHSSVNILMGSRAFYEGWDSTRPNIINFVNIGTQKESRKFILQSLGRGIRIEPVPNQRKRLAALIEDGVLPKDLAPFKTIAQVVETLFVFGTNPAAINAVLETLEAERTEREELLKGFEETTPTMPLWIPTYQPLQAQQEKKLLRMVMHQDDYTVFEDLMTTMPTVALMLEYNLTQKEVSLLQQQASPRCFNVVQTGKMGKNAVILRQILKYYSVVQEEVGGFEVLGDAIRHYQQIKVRVSADGTNAAVTKHDFKQLQNAVEKAKSVKLREEAEAELDEQLNKKLIDLPTYKVRFRNLDRISETGEEAFEYKGQRLRIKKLAQHLYFPSIISKNGRVRWLKHIIDTQSEVDFLEALEKHLSEDGNFFQQFDSWFFSKIDPTLDKKLRIPYTDPKSGSRDFLPDFIFWLKKGKNYHILYLDPKGTGRTEYMHKVDGYIKLFETEDGTPKVFPFQDQHLRVHLRLITEDFNALGQHDNYRKYWCERNNLTQLFVADI
jgi:type III restriction enzyme